MRALLRCSLMLALWLATAPSHAQSAQSAHNVQQPYVSPGGGVLVPLPAPGSAPRYAPGPRHQLTPSANAYEAARLKRERPSLFWPIGSLAVSGGAAVGIAVIIGAAWLLPPAFGYDWPSRQDVRDTRPVFIGAGVAALIAGASAYWLVNTLQRRRPYNMRIRDLATTPALIRW